MPLNVWGWGLRGLAVGHPDAGRRMLCFSPRPGVAGTREFAAGQAVGSTTPTSGGPTESQLLSCFPQVRH